MNKHLVFVAFAALALTACRGRSEQPAPVVEENIEYHPLVTDSAAIDSINNSGMVDNDAAMEYPDIPKDGEINMKANDDEIQEIFSGKGDGDMTKEEGNF